jgi:hypothetical protein
VHKGPVRPTTPTCRRAPAPLPKSRNHSSLTEGRKAPQLEPYPSAPLGVRFPASLRLRKLLEPQEKLKTPTTGAEGIETVNQKQLQICKSQCRMKQQDNHSPSKANSNTKDLYNCIEEEISDIEFQKTIVRMIN